MANTKIHGRQWPLIVTTPVMGIANIGAGNGYDIKIPAGAYLLQVYPDTLTAFDGTTNTLTVGDGTTTFVNAQDVKSTGRETVATPNKYYPSGGTISVTMAQTGTATVGAAIVLLEYILVDRVTETISN